MRTPRIITAATTGVALAALAACGGTGGSAASGGPASSPSSRTTGPSERAPSRATTSPDTADVTFRTTLSTRIVFGDGQITSLDVAGAYRSGAHPAAELTRTGGGRAAPQELRLVGDTLYIRRGSVMRPGGGGKPWTRVTRTTSSMPLSHLLSAVERGRPAVLFRMIGTSHSGSGTLDTAAGLRRLPAADRWPARTLTGFRTLHYDVELDSAGRPSRVTLTGSSGDRRLTLTQTFDHYGTAVHVSAPPPRQVEDGDGPVLPHAPR